MKKIPNEKIAKYLGLKVEDIISQEVVSYDCLLVFTSKGYKACSIDLCRRLKLGKQ